MKTHITKAVAVLMAFITLMSVMPLAALAELLPTASAPYDFNGDGVIDAADADIFASVEQGKVTSGTSYNATMSVPIDKNNDGVEEYYDTSEGNMRVVYEGYSPYEPDSTKDENHPFIQNGTAWINLAELYYGAPATPNTPITKWSANTSVYNTTGTGEYYPSDLTYTSGGGTYTTPVAGKEIYALPDMNLIDEYLWANYEATVSNETQNGIINSKDHVPYTGEAGNATNINTNSVTQKNGETAYVYNRYDPMQGKWGLTLDKNVSSVTWTPTTRPNYWSQDDHKNGTADLNNSILYLSDTPYLYYSTEAPDTTKIAISLLIGTPVQSEYKTSDATDNHKFLPTWTTEKEFNTATGEEVAKGQGVVEYVYRWYTITDNSARPGIDVSTRDNSMVPIVHISDPVIWDADKLNGGQSTEVINALINGYEEFAWNWTHINPETGEPYGTTWHDGDADKLNPITWATKEVEGFDAETLYANGSITGCIDFTTILPLLMDNMASESSSGAGRKDVRYKIAQVRVDTKTAEGADNSAARLNYLYFGPGLSAIYTPQSTLGSSVNAANWQYAQNVASIADDAPGGGYNEADANDVAFDRHNTKYSKDGYDAGYTNGWENGESVSIINTPKNPHTMIIDTYGDGNGQLVDVPYKDGHPTYAVGNNKSSAASSAVTSGDHSKLWKVDVDGDGELEIFEAEYNETNGKYYIMVTIPVRKWIDVLGTARKLSMTMSVQEYGKENTANQDISFVLWGNKNGSVGAGHSTNGTRFRGEGLLAVFGNDTYYQVDNGADYATVLIDQTLGQSTVYNTKKVVTLHHRPNKNDESNTTTRWNITEVEGLTEYADADGNVYYLSKSGNTWYTVEPELAHDKYPIYGHMSGDHQAYYYNPETFELFDMDDQKVTSNLSINVMEPIYNFTQIEDPRTAKTLTMQYNNDEMWADLLRSPYMYGELAKGANAKYAYGDEMAGYVFVTSLRFAMPIGAKVTVQNMKGDDNSAGLNMYSTEGSVVNAYDGGTGEQPEINVKGDLKEAAYSTTNKNIDYDNGTAQGTMKSGAAAYGPYLVTSDYTIYDMLDTEDILAKGADSDQADRVQKIVGIPFKVKTGLNSTYKSIQVWSYPHGDTWGSTGATVSFKSTSGNTYNSTCVGQIEEGKYFLVYGTVTFTDKAATASGGTEIWGLISHGNNAFAWVKLAYNSTYRVDQVYYAHHTYSGRTDYAFEATYSAMNKVADSTYVDYHYNDTTTQLIGTLKNVWVNTFFSDSNADLAGNSYTNSASTLFTSYGTPRPNNQMMSDTHWLKRTKTMRISAENSTDTVFKYHYFDDLTYTNWRYASIGRAMKQQARLDIDSDGSEKTWPVLYYDFTDWKLESEDGQTTSTGGSIIAIIIQKDDTTNYVYYLNGSGELTSAQPSSYGGMCGYASMKNVMEALGYVHGAENNPKLEVIGFNIFYTCEGSKGNVVLTKGTMTMRRFEVWVDETNYLDAIYTKNGSLHDHGYNAGRNIDVADSFNLINDAYYSVHDESNDGGSYKKNNSNKGWSAELRVDTNNDGNLNEFDTIYKSTSPSVENVYEYRTSLGHLRVWVPGKTEASVAFSSDRSFNTKNYKYLYYSYSVRDPHSGIAAANANEIPGITVALKKSRFAQDQAFLQNGYEGFIGFQTNEKYWTHDAGATDWREGTYTTTMNAAIDLTTLNNAGVDSINQVVFYLNNKNLNTTAEFYINYVVLSNVAPNTMVEKRITEPHIQYYYLMDNTGDRYSARFPTIDNPTGAVTGTNSDNDRVNPVKCERGDFLMYGTYFNGDPLYGYGGSLNDGRTFDETTASVGKYEKTYGCTDTNLLTGSLKNILFYMGEGTNEDDYTDILDYYQYKDRNGDGKGDVTDMLWSYGRWNLGSGESGMNTMFVPDPSGAPEGNLTRRYATENYVLLRSGIEPRKYATYYDAGEDGEFFYEGSDALENEIGNTATNKSYYLTETVLNAYFMFPRDVDKNADGHAEIIEPKRYGYTFAGWKRDETEPDALHTYDRKKVPGIDYFVAQWEKDPNFNVTNTAVFFNGSGAEWVTRNAVQDKTHKIILPSAGLMWTPNGSKIVAGWKAYTDENCTEPYMISIPGEYEKDAQGNVVFVDGKPVLKKQHATYYSASTITMKVPNLWFKPILVDPSAESDELITVTVTDATLELYISGENGNFVTNDPAKQGIGVKEGSSKNTLVYYNVPKGTAMVAYPTANAASQLGNNAAWTSPWTSNGNINADGKDAVLSTNKDYFRFSASNHGLTINYGPKDDANGQVGNVTTFMNPRVANRQMTFSSQFEKVDGYTAVAWGTLYLTGAQNPANPANFVNYMQLDESKIDAAAIASGGFTTKISAVKQVKASSANGSNQYSLTYAASTEAARTMWMRAYVIYQKDGTDAAPVYEVTYSNYIVQASVGAYSTTDKTDEV